MFIPDKRKKILAIFFKNPFKEIHLREIARLSKVSLTNVDITMRLLVKEGMFNKRAVSRMTFFRPNLENGAILKTFELLELEKKSEFYNKNKMIARLLQKYAKEIIELSNNKIQSVILFGSVARGEWTKGSDVDILAIASEKDASIIKILNKTKENVSPILEIRAISTTVDKFIKGFKSKTEFNEEIWRDRIVLYNEFLFWQMVKEGGRIYG